MKRLRAVCTSLTLLPAALTAGGQDAPAALGRVHENASGTVRFRTPEDWAVSTQPGVPEVSEARGGGLIVRILRREGELGLDSLHIDCMLLRLAGGTEAEPAVDYEYDFLEGRLAERKVLDSAFVVHYDAAIDGARAWRQRNVTIVGEGESVCVVGYAPLPALKRSKEMRRTFDAVLASIELGPWR